MAGVDPLSVPGLIRLFRPALPSALLCLALALGGCGGGAPVSPTFDLSAPREFGRASGRATLVVAEPSALQVLDSDRIIVREAGGALSYLGGGQWADRLPKLVQTRLIQTFENASRIGAVGRPGERISADFQLNTDIRSFMVDAERGEAVVEITAKLVRDRNGRIGGGRVFQARVPVGSVEPAGASQALDRAFSQVLIEIVRWARV